MVNNTQWKQFTAEEKIRRAKIQAQPKSKFFGYLLLRIPIEHNDKMVPSMGVTKEGKCYYNEKWVNTLTEPELIGVLLHETIHLAFLHLFRKGSREHEKWNIANDLTANTILVNEGFSLPEGIVPKNGQYTFKKEDGYAQEVTVKTVDDNNEPLSSEVLYEQIPDAPKQGQGEGQGQGQPPKNWDEHVYGNSKDKEQNSQKEREWKAAISEAATYAKSKGDLPAYVETLVEDLLDPKINWKEKLYRYVVAQLPYDFDWGKRNKRSYGVGVYLPGIKKESLEVIWSFDTSGSMSQEELSEGLTEAHNLATSFQNTRMFVIMADAEVHRTYDISSYDLEELKNLVFEGRGGTSHKPTIEYIKEHQPNCRIAIHWTDGWSDINEVEHDDLPFDNLWVITKGGVNPEEISWGDVIKIER